LTDDFQRIYEHDAEAYDALVAHEDHENNLVAALRQIVPRDGIDVVETGAGTGRVSLLLAPFARSVRAFDRAAPMLAVAESKARARGLGNVRFAPASHDGLPVESGTADLAIEGWAFGHAVGWNPAGWMDEVDGYVRELSRMLRPGGVLVLIETMGTGVQAPFEGGHPLEAFHRHIVQKHRLSHRCVRTDYAFASLEEAVRHTGFFFGEALADKVRTNGWRVVPEHTAVYWRGA
jgi:ubiquinone/menaquinone biosynthesis C-methylase UbiE